MSEKVSVSFDVDAALYEEAKEALRSFAVTPEYALQRFLLECVRKKRILLKRFKAGERAEDLISETADAALENIIQETQHYRKILSEMKFQEKEISITHLRLHWGSELRWLESPGNALLITRNKKREVAMISVTTDLAITSVSVDDEMIRKRCELLDLL